MTTGNETILQLAAQVGSADTTSIFYAVGTSGTTDTQLSLPVLVHNLGLTGVPTAPTAAMNTNTTQIASTSYVINQGYLTAATAASTYAPIASPTFTGSITGASASINLGGAASFASIQSTPVGSTSASTGSFTTLTNSGAFTVNGSISGPGITTLLNPYAPLASPTFSGTVSAPLVSLTDPSNTSSTLTVTNTGANGASIKLVGNGATTPNKYIRANTGTFQVINSGYTASILTLDDVGNLTVSGSITPSQTGGIIGTTTNNNATAGSVGEYVTATAGPISLTTGTYVDLVTVSLTAGDWDVTGTVGFTPAGTTTVSALVTGVNTVLNTSANTFTFQMPFTTGGSQQLPVQLARFSLASTTTVRIGAQANFGVSTCNASGTIRARRVR